MRIGVDLGVCCRGEEGGFGQLSVTRAPRISPDPLTLTLQAHFVTGELAAKSSLSCFSLSTMVLV
jgi:hypothetical protein